MGKRKIIDISTEEKKKKVFDEFNNLNSKNQAHNYFGISDNKQGSEYLKEIATSVGFNLETYKERKNKPIRYCKECGKEITSKWGKDFCCSSCAAKYNNKRRDKSVYEKVSNKLRKNVLKEKCCLNCGKILNKKQRKYCSIKCQMELYKKNKISEWKENAEKFNSESSYSFIRNFLLKKYNNKCEKCGWGEEHPITKSVPLEVHHIDGDCTNNKEENLQLLCPNCHSLTENFGSRNKNSKRYKLKNYKRNLQFFNE